MGYDRFYGFIGGETNNRYPTLAEDNHYINQPLTHRSSAEPARPGSDASAAATITTHRTRSRSASRC
jgi:hypothetical protein